MARIPLTLPKVGLVMENARVVRWLKAPGDEVRLGEPLLELETEKSVVEIEAAAAGRLLETLLQAGAPARIGDVLAWLEDGTAAVAHTEPRGAGTAAEQRATGPAAAPASPPQPCTPPGRIRASPAARRLARENRVALREVRPTGPRGRIQLADVRRALGAAPPVQTVADAGSGASNETVALTPMRRAIARSMTLSCATMPQFFVERTVDWTAVRAQRAQLLARLPQGRIRPSLTDFMLQAIARALLACPALNATFAGEVDSPEAAIVPADGAHIGLVVDVGRGLVVPVLHGIERAGIAELAGRRADLVARAQSGRLRQEELTGATFSLSNLGPAGPDRFSALLNPPQSAILAVGRERNVAIVIGEGIFVRPVSQLTLTVDHRVADGRLAAEFLTTLVEILEGHAWQLE
jgi:pyruvate dehydrogenase E2 component (dihydrolipoamide acetyltransferase)